MQGMIWKTAWIIPRVLARSRDTLAKQECVFTGILHTKCGKQILLTARSQTATRALSTLLLLHDPESSKKANRTLGKLLCAKKTKKTQTKTNHPTKTKPSIRFPWTKKQKEGEGCQAAMAVITVIFWLGIISTRRNSFVM